MALHHELLTGLETIETLSQRVFALPIVGLLTRPFGVSFYWKKGLLVKEWNDGVREYRDPKTHRVVSTPSN